MSLHEYTLSTACFSCSFCCDHNACGFLNVFFFSLQLLEEQSVRDQAEARAAEKAMEAQLNQDDTARTLETSPDESMKL